MSGQYVGDALLAADLPKPSSITALQASSHISFDSEEAIEELDSRYGVDAGGLLGAFSGSVEYQRMRHSLSSSYEAHVSGELFAVIEYQASDVSPEAVLRLSPGLADAIAGLPDAGGGSAFTEFFERHGTHYLSKAYFGGSMKIGFDASISRDDLTDSFRSSFKLGAASSFQKMVGLPADMQGVVTASDEDIRTFQSHSSFSSHHLSTAGGDPTKVTWDEWKATVLSHDLALVAQEFATMDRLVLAVGNGTGWSSDEVVRRRNAMYAALQAYLLACPGACSKHGLCMVETGSCTCDADFFGADCSQYDSKCKTQSFTGDIECHGQSLLRHPVITHSQYPTCIASCLHRCDARWGCDCNMPAAHAYCELMMGKGSTALSYELGDPVCDWDVWGCDPFCRPYTLGDQSFIDIGGWHWGFECDHPDVFASIQCQLCPHAGEPAVAQRVAAEQPGPTPKSRHSMVAV